MEADPGHLSDRHFRSVADLVQQHAGIQLPPAKRTMVEGRLRRRMRALDLPTLEAYGRHLFEAGHLADEFPHLVDCVTTNKTDFFREPAHFDLLRATIVPRLAARGDRPLLKVWSAAASTGAEAYTLAMVLQDMAGDRFRYAILGTDISSEVLDRARTAIYPGGDAGRRAAGPAAALRDGRARPGPARGADRAGAARPGAFPAAQPDGRGAYPIDRDVDLVFCRNVLIYFDKPTQKAVVARLAAHLRPGGYLIVGHSESMAGVGVAGLDQMSPTVFSKLRDSGR